MKAKYTMKEDISVEARDLLKGLLEKDPQKRLSISQTLAHPWLADAVDASDMELFTEQERQYIKSEYSYGKSSRYGRNNDMAGTAT
jgi:serine/threonine protein kinase